MSEGGSAAAMAQGCLCAARFREIQQLYSCKPGTSAGMLRPLHTQFG